MCVNFGPIIQLHFDPAAIKEMYMETDFGEDAKEPFGISLTKDYPMKLVIIADDKELGLRKYTYQIKGGCEVEYIAEYQI